MPRRAVPEVSDETVVDKPAPKRKSTKSTKATRAASDGDKATRRRQGERGWLAVAIDGICRDIDAGKSKLEAPYTVHKIAQEITNDSGEHPSTGAVAAALARWEEQGYVRVDPKPLAFKAFTAAGRKTTLAEFMTAYKAKARAERKAA